VSGEVAGIVAATPDGHTLVYTDSEEEEVGFVNITTPGTPSEIGTVPMPGSPTSVAITPDGLWALVTVQGDDNVLVVIRLSDRSIEHTIVLDETLVPAAPDHVAVSPDGQYAAITIENERDEDVNDGEMPQAPPGSLVIIDIYADPADPTAWGLRRVSLTGIADRFSDDPEPEYVDINADNIAAVTLQENNHIVFVDLALGTVIGDFPAGTSTHAADLVEDDVVSFTDTLTNARREPDAIQWTPGGRLLVANEGDYDLDLADGEFTGGRDFTVFSTAGKVLYEPDGSLEMAAAAEGVYNDGRSENSGCEFEGAEVAKYGKTTFGFIGSERCDFVAVYKMSKKETRPKLVQLLTLPAGSRPEGLLAIPQRQLFVAANEATGTIAIYLGDKKKLDEDDE
jgi:DNA-binding beta-propeller fold protein YncE